MTDALRENLLTMARYKAWATARLYAHIDALSEADYRRAVGLFFGSIHGTLNHLWVAEHLLWWERFANSRSPKVALDAQPLQDRSQLRASLLEGAKRWVPFIQGLDAQRFKTRLDYTTTQGVATSLPFSAVLSHVFNHGTHHRGQITAAITAMGHACPEIDLVWMLQEENQ